MVQSIMKKFKVHLNPEFFLSNTPTVILVEAEKVDLRVDLRGDYAVFYIDGLISGLCRSPVSVLVQTEDEADRLEKELREGRARIESSIAASNISRDCSDPHD